MKNIFTLLLLSCFTTMTWAKEHKTYQKLCEVNKCWTEQTDISNLELPEYTHQTERDWIRTHLQLVEQTLRARSTSNLSTAQKVNRLAALDDLHRYWQGGSFPTNDEYNKRTPIFIDKHDNFCAVGHLVKATGHEQVSRMIAAKTNLAYVREMNYPELTAWASEYGFTKEELAWIQPGYPPTNHVKPIGKGTDGNVHELFVDSVVGRLYVGGEFTNVDSTMTANNIAYITEEDGVYTWHTMGKGMNGPIHAITVADGKVYAAGKFTEADGKPVNNIAYWNGTTWNALGCISGMIKDIVAFDNNVYAVGDFDICASAAEVNFARWDGKGWRSATLGHALVGRINTMYDIAGYSLILGGKFSYDGDSVNIIEYNKFGGFQKYSNGIGNEVNYIGRHGYELYAGTTGDVDTTKLVLKLGLSNDWGAIYQYGFKAVDKHSVRTICSRGKDVLVGGDLNYSGNISPGPKGYNCGMISQNQLTTYDGVWVDSVINVMIMFNGRLVVGGNFNHGYSGSQNNDKINSIASGEAGLSVSDVEAPIAHFTIYPNPASKRITIENDFNANTFRLSNIGGQLVAEQDLSNTEMQTIELPSLAAGVYMVELKSEKGVSATQMLIIE